ncbi:unnamed protein product [Pseudo-nitzschia multistriata]|uniref:Uncharacterized protein n=1 Tax=Pseudo-nitzschia multistriata TaxID=183589 RepID=A0A448ZAZ5_9STRA|nr:unnamed protein product [Pseudo-nitzschia multistriata]
MAIGFKTIPYLHEIEEGGGGDLGDANSDRNGFSHCGINETTALLVATPRVYGLFTSDRMVLATSRGERTIKRKSSSGFLAIVVSATAMAFLVLVLAHCTNCKIFFFDASVSMTIGTRFYSTNNAVLEPIPQPITETTTTTTEYGEVWLIRHGEKDSASAFVESSSSWSPNGGNLNLRQRMRLQTILYELNAKGWDRAEHLGSLVKAKQWPEFHALFATRPPTAQEIEDAVENNPLDYFAIARDPTGQSLVWREYQTLLPISDYLRQPIVADFCKGDTKEAALEIAKTAVHASESGKPGPGSPDLSILALPAAGNVTNINITNSNNRSNIVLVSWDHCSLPTLVVDGFGCKEIECYRCWSDHRFGDVLKLNVSVTTTTTSSNRTDANDSEPLAVGTLQSSKSTNTDTDTVVRQQVSVSSTILSMTGESYPGDDYCYVDHDEEPDGVGNSPDHVTSTPTSVSIRKSTPCVTSYCSNRPSAGFLVDCLCYRHGKNEDDDANAIMETNNVRDGVNEEKDHTKEKEDLASSSSGWISLMKQIQ